MSFSILINDLRRAQSNAFAEVVSDAYIAQDRNEIAQILVDIDSCVDILVGRYEGELYELAIKEVQLSLLAALGASYRQAFVGLRLALEHWFAAIQYSTNEFNFRKWQLGKRDTSWAELNDKDIGVLSDEFAIIFWPQTEQRISIYRNFAASVYRECSEYVHGNPKTHLSLPKQLMYDRKSFLSWKEKLETVKLLFVYTFVLRFGSLLTVNDRESISQVVLDTIGHLNEARELFKGD
jgi:hypothetical protein